MANDEPEEGTKPSLTQTLTDITSSSSDGTAAQKRFSFYDAQEVQLQCGGVGVTESITTPPEEEEKEKQNLHRFNFYDPTLLADENTPNKNKSKNTTVISTNNDILSQHKQQQHGQTLQQQQQQEERQPKFELNVESVLSPVADANLEEEKPPEESKNNTDDILRSLQETEEQRIQILKTVPPCDNSTTSTTNGTSSRMTTTSTSTGVNIAAATADTTTASATGGNDDNGDGSDDNSNTNMNNPYEDSIRAALTLLRKHRSPPHSPSVDDMTTNGATSTENNNSNNVNIDPNHHHHQSERRDRTPKEQDRLLQYRSYDEDDDVDHKANNDDVDDDETLLNKTSGPSVDDAVQVAKLKSKQRQERMAKYATRLQEFKSNSAPEQQLERQLSSSYQSFDQDMQQDQDESSPRMEGDHKNHDGSNNSAPPNHIHHTVKTSLTDSDSVGLVSELSQYSNQQRQLPPPPPHSQIGHTHPNQQVIIEEQVQKGVEKVLVAILEASKSKSVSGDSSCRSTRADNMSTHSGDNVSDALLQVLDEVLHPSRSIDASIESLSRSRGEGEKTNKHNRYNPNDIHTTGSYEVSGVATMASKHSVSVMSQESVNSRSLKSSVVDELLAEVDDDEIGSALVQQQQQQQQLKASTALLADVSGTRNPPPISCNSNAAARYWTDDEKKVTEDRGYSEPLETTTVGLSSVNKTNRNVITANFDNESILEEEGIDALLEDSMDDSKTSGGEEHSESESSGSVDDEDDELNTEFDEDESYEDDDDEDNDEEHRGGVLGPLSRKAGGTTGVVLDVESDSPSVGRENTQKGYFSSVTNHVASALTPDEQRILDNKRKEKILANYDAVGTSTQDKEAFELMRTLCAHLLPFGVDQKSQESVPVWDDENPNEAGYRIIRLSKSQLRRVERAFDAMITRLKHNSHSSLNGVEGQFDANFIRELEEAERLLDDEEKRNVVDAKDVPTDNVLIRPRTPSTATNDEECAVDSSHPEFPGVKGAGKGEMGDLEYFQLPIIFKSHVTGFEPTKDMALEPGNVIAGQYLVESELGSAAFSTAYRCIDLSSDDTDGHEEVCLKVIKNTKDFFDQSLDEIKILELLRQTGKCDENYILRVKTFFYYREHLIIVTELLRQNLFEFGKFVLDNNEEPYFTLPRLAYITRQCLVALRFVHSLGLVHSDVKPENILLGSYSRAQIKLIDFGSSCYLTDRQSSYIQSRSYRAPEVVLGLPYDGKIDVWSLGCVVAEMYTGEVIFQNDSIVSMLSRIEAFRGSFPRHMIAQGRQCGRFFTKSGLLYEIVDESDRDEAASRTPPGPDDESDSENESEKAQFDIFQPKSTRLSSRLGFDDDLMDDCGEKNIPSERQIKQMFTDFVARLLTIDPDGRPSAEEALNHPWMLYASSLTDDQIKYPANN
jgi:serine/threonine protein kinase